MLLQFVLFEIRYWLRGAMVWVFTAVLALMIFGAASSDKIVVGSSLQNTFRNAPFAIQNFYAVSSILTLLMTVTFVNSAASRDFSSNTAQIIFSKPIRRMDFLLGRYIGASLVAVIPILGVSLGVLAAPFAQWADSDRFGPVAWHAHWNSILVLAIPNTLFIAAVIFTVAVLTRSTVTSFLSGLILLVAYLASESLMSDLKNEQLAALLDPFAARTFSLATKYWTVAEKNTLSLGWEGLLLWNRLIWLAAGFAVFALGCYLFRFEERAGKRAKRPKADAQGTLTVAAAAIDSPIRQHSRRAQWLGALRVELLVLFKSTGFIVISLAALLNCLPNLIFNANESYGNQSLPVTYWILALIGGTLNLFLVAIITYYSGVLVWRNREAGFDSIHDALPHPEWIDYTSKLVALLVAAGVIQLMAMACGLGVQAYGGYHRYQIGLYVTELFGVDFSGFFFLAILAFLMHVLAPNQYVGYFLYLTFLIANAFIWRPLNVASLLLQYGERPRYVYSDFYRYEPYLPGWGWFTAYWLAFAALLMILTAVLWPRGRETALAARWRIGQVRWGSTWRLATAAAAACFLASGGWAFYNTKILNVLIAPKTALQMRAGYEKSYKKYANLPLPRVQDVRFEIDLYPESRNIVMRVDEKIRNVSAGPIGEIHFTLSRDYDVEMSLPGSVLTAEDRRLSYRIYRLTPPMLPGEERQLKITLRSRTRGFENSLSNAQLMPNGTFFNNSIVPQIGYQTEVELSERNERKEYQLPEKDLMPALERNCTANCRNNYLSNSSDWVSVHTVISTSPDQIAVAPGSLLRQWNQNGRSYFEYQLDRDSLNFYSFISARYQIAREEWNGVKVEVYYQAEHPWNVPKMLKSIKQSLAYCSSNFGAYGHKQARIIEFPRVASFAQAFPGTMPYSESIGFIANLDKPDSIDMVYYVVAHEMAHQWWAHQVVGAQMQGATLLSETMAQYVALMIMEKEYGRDQMHKFLDYEMDRYLRSRGTETLKERPLLTVESEQGYIHYRKGSVVMYALREAIGEAAVNRALRKLIQKYGYQGAPYPTSYALLDLLREETPADLQYLLKDLIEDITLFSNRTLSAQAKKRSDGRYDVAIEVQVQKLKADAKGTETEVPMNDFVEVGAFTEPAKGQKYGRLLHRERVRLTTGKHRLSFVVSEFPAKAGVDPLNLLVDRLPSDNLRKVDASE